MREDKESDLWETPQWLFDELNEEFNFEIDLCANKDNHKCNMYFNNYLVKDMSTGSLLGFNIAFMNPPYSNPLPFINKAYEDSKYCKIVMLIKCDTSTKAWGVFWNYRKDMWWALKPGTKDKFITNSNPIGPKPGVEVRFLPKRLKFERGGIPSKNCANFPSAIVIMDRRGL